MMKYIPIIIISAMCFFVACSADADAKKSENPAPQVETKKKRIDTTANLHALGIGTVQVGMTSEQIESMEIPYEKKSVNLEGDDYIKYDIVISDSVIVSANMDHGGQVSSITTFSPAIKDEYGNGVGSDIIDLQNSYPHGRLIKGNADGEYLRFLTATPLIFSMDINTVPKNCFEFNVECDFSLYTKVISLEIGRHAPK